MLRSAPLRARLEARTTMVAWTYMLLCRDGSFYVGCTTNLENRIGEHIAGTNPGYTSVRRPVELVWSEEFQYLDDAVAAERRIKGWSRVKKQALIVSDWNTIRRTGSRGKSG